MEINSMTSMNDHEAVISSDSKTTNDSPEESSWTFYMQDFLCGYGKDDHESSISSSCPFLVSDAASSAARKLATHDNYKAAAEFTSDRSNCKKLISRRGKAKGAALTDDLEDTASSPVNSPKNHESDDTSVSQRHHIQGYPSIRIFRKGSDLREDHGHHDHESYYGDRDTDGLVKTMEDLVASVSLESQRLALDGSTGGCRVEGFVRVKKVPGNLVKSARSAAHSFDASQMNMSHLISHFSFGKKISPRERSDVIRLLPWLLRSHDKLDGLSYISNPSDSNANVTIEHYLQVVKTEVMTRTYKLVEEYEYTAHSSLVHSVHIPVAKFHFELSPMQVLITENSKSFSHFITNVCAIIGGVFTVAGILDSILHNSMRLMKKVELGKNY